MADITHRVGMKAPVSKVYAALSTVEASPVGGQRIRLVHPGLVERSKFVSIQRMERRSGA